MVCQNFFVYEFKIPGKQYNIIQTVIITYWLNTTHYKTDAHNTEIGCDQHGNNKLLKAK